MNIGLHTDRQTEKNLVFYLSPFTILLSPFLSIVCPELWCLFTYSLFVFVTNMSTMSVVLVSLWLFFSFSLSFMRFVHCGYFLPLIPSSVISPFSFLFLFFWLLFLSGFYFILSPLFFFLVLCFYEICTSSSLMCPSSGSQSLFFCIILFLFAVFSFSFLYPLTSLRFPSKNIFFFP